MNNPQFKIYGIERRKVKKELSELNSYVKNFWYFHQLDKDMASFYGGEERLMNDVDAQQKIDQAKNKIKELQIKLSIVYIK